MSTLDKFFPPTVVSQKSDTGIYVEERCSNPKCRKIIGVNEPKYTLLIRGEKKPFCRDCARTYLPKPKPKEMSGNETSEEEPE